VATLDLPVCPRHVRASTTSFRAPAIYSTSFFSSEMDLPDSLAVKHPRIYSDTRHTASYHKSEPLLLLPSYFAKAEASSGTSQTTYGLSTAGGVGTFSTLDSLLTSCQMQPWLCKRVEWLQHPPKLPPSNARQKCDATKLVPENKHEHAQQDRRSNTIVFSNVFSYESGH
jgi:hypothetical protein